MLTHTRLSATDLYDVFWRGLSKLALTGENLSGSAYKALTLLHSSGLGATEEERSGSSNSSLTPALIPQVDRRAAEQAGSSQGLRSQTGVSAYICRWNLNKLHFSHVCLYQVS